MSQSEFSPSATEEDIVALLKSGLIQMVATMKNMCLYPQSSPVYIKSLDTLAQWFNQFLEQYSSVVLTVTREGLAYETGDWKQEPVYVEKPSERVLSTPLFRDGVQALELYHGLNRTELETFLNLLIEFRTISDEDEDDLVTALWSHDFDYIRYEADSYMAGSGNGLDVEIGRLPKQLTGSKGRSEGLDPAVEGKEGDHQSYLAADQVKPAEALFTLAEDLAITGQGEEGVAAVIPEDLDTFFGGNLLVDDPALAESSLGQADDGDNLPPVSSQTAAGGKEGSHQGPAQDHNPAQSHNPESQSSAKSQQSQSQQSQSQSPAEPSLDPVQSMFSNGLEQAKTWTDIQGNDDSPEAIIRRASEKVEEAASSRLDFWQLDQSEEDYVRQLIEWEGKRNSTRDSLELVLILLNVPPSGRKDFQEAIAFFLAEASKEAVSGHGLKLLNVFLEKFENLIQKGGDEVLAVAGSYHKKLISREFLEVMVNPEPPDDELDRIYNSLRRFFFQIPPASLLALIPMVPEVSSLKLQGLFMDVIGTRAHLIDDKSLADTVRTLPQNFILRLLRLWDDDRYISPIYLFGVLARHTAGPVRLEAARLLIKDSEAHLGILIPLLVDRMAMVRKLVMGEIGKRPNPLAEAFLLDYLRETHQNHESVVDEDQIMECYQTLGHCASEASVPFLRDILLKRSLKALLGRGQDVHRQGAALALSLMPREWGAEEILQKASRSAFLDIRRALHSVEDIVRREVR